MKRKVLPLDGVTILDLTSVVAGPLATQILAQQGAKVWKIEPPAGDRARMLGVVAEPGISSSHVALNADKQSVGIDLGLEAGRALLRQLIPLADVLIHNFRPKVLDRMGFDTNSLRELRPDIIIARITGFGPDGPMSGQRAYDPIIQAESGMVAWGDDGPTLAPHYICDKTAGLYAAQAVTAALFERLRTGKGTIVDVSMLEAAVAFSWIDLHCGQIFPDQTTNTFNITQVYRPWSTSDGWIVVVMLSQSEFEGWADVVGLPELITDPRFSDTAARFRNWDALRLSSAPHIASLDTATAIAALKRAEVPCAAVNSSEALLSHPQLVRDDFLACVNQDRIGRVRIPRPVARFDGERLDVTKNWPVVGAHGSTVFAQAGLQENEIEAAFACGAAHQQQEIE
jgi:crotonobetainyl-CoA:carnitine CoA-transferase CaiB-like acyl-CoA transferase